MGFSDGSLDLTAREGRVRVLSCPPAPLPRPAKLGWDLGWHGVAWRREALERGMQGTVSSLMGLASFRG